MGLEWKNVKRHFRKKDERINNKIKYHRKKYNNMEKFMSTWKIHILSI